MNALFPGGTLAGLDSANWKERLSAVEKMLEVRLLKWLALLHSFDRLSFECRHKDGSCAGISCAASISAPSMWDWSVIFVDKFVPPSFSLVLFKDCLFKFHVD